MRPQLRKETHEVHEFQEGDGRTEVACGSSSQLLVGDAYAYLYATFPLPDGLRGRGRRREHACFAVCAHGRYCTPGVKKAATTDGLVVSTHARFGFEAAGGTTDDARIRDITQALPPQWADRLFQARDAGANEQQLQRIAAEGLAEIYFRAAGLGVEFTDVEHVQIELWRRLQKRLVSGIEAAGDEAFRIMRGCWPALPKAVTQPGRRAVGPTRTVAVWSPRGRPARTLPGPPPGSRRSPRSHRR